MPDMLEKLRADVEAALTYDGEDSLAAVDRAALRVIDEFCAGLEVVEVYHCGALGANPESWHNAISTGCNLDLRFTIFIPRTKEQSLAEAAQVVLDRLVEPFCALAEEGSIAKLMQAGMDLREALKRESQEEKE